MTYPLLGQQYSAQQATSLLAPSVPLNVTSAAFDSGAVVYWQHPGDHAVTSFTITPYITGTPGSTTTVNGGVRQANVTGLTNSTAYTFSVHATNTNGSSAESVQSGANTPLANLIFGDDFTGTVLSPCWQAWQRDSDQSNSETCYYQPKQVTLDGTTNVLLTALNQQCGANTYADGNPPTYAGGQVTRTYTSGAMSMVYPGSITTSQGMAVSGFTQPGFNYVYGKVQISMKVSDLTSAGAPSGGWPAAWAMGSQGQQILPLNPDNVGTMNWHAAGSEEIDIGEYAGTTAAPTAYTPVCFEATGSGPAGTISATTPHTTYHTYEVDWSAGLINWLLDSGQQATWSTSVPSTAMFLVFTNAMQGTVTAFTQPSMIIDWVRIFHN